MDKDTALYIARLSRLALSDDEKEEIIKDFTKIVGFVEKIKELDISSIKEDYILVNPNENVFRQDVVVKVNLQSEIEENAPQYEDGFFVVPKVIEK
jgi:aspartyl-tRNA(Asn)/glutamyl-tRNA(Gln) amidotransferase subunit C